MSHMSHLLRGPLYVDIDGPVYCNRRQRRSELRPQGVTHALAAGADKRIRRGKNAGFRFGVLLGLCDGVDDPADKADDDG